MRTCDFLVVGGGVVGLSIARDALDMQEVDSEGMDKQDRRYLETLIQVFRGGPSGADWGTAA